VSLVDKYISQSLAQMASKPESTCLRCRKCKTLLIDMLSGQRDCKQEAMRLCIQCFNGKKKQCACGQFHTLPNLECFDCFMKKRKEKNSEPTE